MANISKPIKLPKDTQGVEYYPATVTDAVVHPGLRKSLTDIIDNINASGVPIVEYVDELDSEAPIGSLAVMLGDSYAGDTETSFSEIDAEPERIVSIKVGYGNTGRAISTSGSLELTATDGSESLFLNLTVTNSTHLNFEYSYGEDTYQLASYDYAGRPPVLNIAAGNLEYLNELLSTKEFICTTPGDEINDHINGWLIPTASRMKQEIIIYNKNTSKHWEQYLVTMSMLTDDVKDIISGIIVNSISELPSDAKTGQLATVLNTKEQLSDIPKEGVITNIVLMDNLDSISFPPSQFTELKINGLGSMTITNSGYPPNFSLGLKLGNVTVATWDSTGKLSINDQETIDSYNDALSSGNYSITSNNYNTYFKDYVKTYSYISTSSLYTKNEMGWEEYQALPADNSVTLEKLADDVKSEFVSQTSLESTLNDYSKTDHNHDDKYITSSSLESTLSDFSKTNHNHDDKYMGITTQVNGTVGDVVITNMVPNKLYRYVGDGCTSITVNSLSAVTAGNYNEYMLEFEAGNGCTFVWPETLKWMNGQEPVFEAGKIYQISIVNNLGVYAQF